MEAVQTKHNAIERLEMHIEIYISKYFLSNSNKISYYS